MKWIGQHIYDQISRFRNHTYFEESITLSTGKSITMDEYTSGTISITKIQDSGTTFADNDTSLMTAAAIADKIEAYGYSTTTGDITGVDLTATTGIDITSESGTTGGNYTATIGVDVSDFMTNGSDNRVLTATGTDAMNAEANLTFDGSSFSCVADTTIQGNLRIGGSGDTSNNWITIDAQNGTDTTGGGICFYETGTDTIGAPQYGAKIVYNEDDDEFAMGTMHNGVFQRQLWMARSWDNIRFADAAYVEGTTPSLAFSDTSTTVANTDVLGILYWTNADDGGTTARIQAVATENHASGANGGTKIEFKTTPNTTSSEVTALTIGQDQSLTTAGNIELGHASDTTIARSASGAVTIEGKRIVTEDRQRQVTHHMFQEDIDTTKYYIGLQESDAENTTQTNKHLPMLAPSAGKLLKVFMRATDNLDGVTLTLSLETKANNAVTQGTPSTVGSVSVTGPTNKGTVTFDFSTIEEGDGIVDLHDMVYLSILSSGATSSAKFYITCVWEWDLSSI